MKAECRLWKKLQELTKKHMKCSIYIGKLKYFQEKKGVKYMSKSKKIIVAVIFVAVLLMAIGYAALDAVELEIGGTASAIANNANFKVYFSGTNTKSSSANATATVTAKTTEATVTIKDLIEKEKEEYVILEILNESEDIDATSVKVTTNEPGTDYIAINAVMCDEDGVEVTGDNPVVAKTGKTYVKVSAKLIETITSPESATINVVVTAEPEELNPQV